MAIDSNVSMRGFESPDSSLDKAAFEIPDKRDSSFSERSLACLSKRIFCPIFKLIFYPQCVFT